MTARIIQLEVQQDAESIALHAALDRELLARASGSYSSYEEQRLSEYIQLQAYARTLERQLDTLSEAIRKDIGFSTAIEAGPYVAMLKQCERTDLDKAALRAALGGNYSQYEKQTKYTQLIVQEQKR